jgi:hypothetical protein
MKYRYGDKTVTVENNVVVASSSPSFPVGSTVSAALLKRCGWKAEKAATVYYSHGGKNSTRFTR